jgi:hypothetical protein
MKQIIFILFLLFSQTSFSDIFCRKVSDFRRTISIDGSGLLKTGVDTVSGPVFGHQAKVSWFANTLTGTGIHINEVDEIPRGIDQGKIKASQKLMNDLFTLDVQFGLGGLYHGEFICLEEGIITIVYNSRKLGDYQIILTKI